MSRVLLVLPPNYCYTYDFFPLGTALLCGYLKQKGIGAQQLDYNLGYLHYWKKKVFPDDCQDAFTTQESVYVIQELLNCVFDQKAQKPYYFSSFFPKTSGFLPYGDRGNSSFVFTERLLASPHLFRYLHDEKENTFLAFYRQERVIDAIKAKNIKVLGISVIAPSQAIAALTLGCLVKNELPDVFVVLGGQWASLYRQPLKELSRLRDCFDGIIYFEGETPLYELVKSLENARSLRYVPNLIYAAPHGFVDTGVSSKENLDLLPCPDFSDLDLQQYSTTQESGRVSLTYQTARECYWNKCAFCVDLPLPKQGFRQRSVALVIDDIKRLMSCHNATFLQISNATIAPQQMRALSEAIIEEKLTFQWHVFARMDPGFTFETLSLARQAGCHTMMFGLESGSQRVLDFIKKGISLEVAKRILQDCRKAGITVSLQMMIGLPSETRDDALQTIDFLLRQRNAIGRVTFNTYYLTPACEVYLNPDQYGIQVLRGKGSRFQFFHEFKHSQSGIGWHEAKAMQALYLALLNKKAGAKLPCETVPSVRLPRTYRVCAEIAQEQASLWYDFDPESKSGQLRDDAQVSCV